ASGAHVVLVPEQPFSIVEVCKTLSKRAKGGKKFSLVVVAEGAKAKEQKEKATKTTAVDAFGNPILGGIGQLLAQEIEKRTGLETRDVVLGHVVRGGSPTAYDRVLATRFGVAAADLVKSGKFGMMVALKGNKIVPVPVGGALAQKTLDLDLLKVSEVFSD
ncbi:MAG: 6-phosphofructokinase, partial [Thaumarchaeota archaeon]|nr:6-phosphofructokinase [Nitrososphaerota archaeon]